MLISRKYVKGTCQNTLKCLKFTNMFHLTQKL